MKKQVKLYNMILPPFMLLTFTPWLATISLIGHFIIDSIVLLIISMIVFKKINGKFYIKNIWKIVLFGYLADIFGAIYLFAINIVTDASFKGEAAISDAISTGIYYAINHGNCYYNMWGFLYMLSGILFAAIVILGLDFIAFYQNDEMSKKQKILSALSFAVFTAPYTFLLPKSLFY